MFFCVSVNLWLLSFARPSSPLNYQYAAIIIGCGTTASLNTTA
jgi:hypothetical protein